MQALVLIPVIHQPGDGIPLLGEFFIEPCQELILLSAPGLHLPFLPLPVLLGDQNLDGVPPLTFYQKLMDSAHLLYILEDFY